MGDKTRIRDDDADGLRVYDPIGRAEMAKNTRRHLKVETVLGEWAVVAYSSPTPHPTDGTVWLRGFDSEEQARVIASRLQEVMKQ